jgi:hypothetical protein
MPNTRVRLYARVIAAAHQVSAFPGRYQLSTFSPPFTIAMRAEQTLFGAETGLFAAGLLDCMYHGGVGSDTNGIAISYCLNFL